MFPLMLVQLPYVMVFLLQAVCGLHSHSGTASRIFYFPDGSAAATTGACSTSVAFLGRREGEEEDSAEVTSVKFAQPPQSSFGSSDDDIDDIDDDIDRDDDLLDIHSPLQQPFALEEPDATHLASKSPRRPPSRRRFRHS